VVWLVEIGAEIYYRGRTAFFLKKVFCFRWRMLERKRAIPSPREPSHKLSPVFQSSLADFPPEIQPNHAASWQTPFMSMGWPYDDNNSMIPRHPPSPDLSSDFSPASTLLELSPISHAIPLAEPPAFPPFRFSSSSLSAALSVSPTLQSSPLSKPNNTTLAPTNDPGPSEDSHSNPRPSGSGLKHSALHNGDRADSRTIADVDRISQGNRETSRHNTFNANFNTNVSGGESTQQNPSPNNHDDRELPASPGKGRVSMLRSGPSVPNGGGDVSSASSTPVAFDTLTLSPISSPASASLPVDLPNSTQSPSTSTLFLPSGEDRQPRRKTLKRSESQGPLRLSSNLLLTSE
jgi:hypothetical protein